MALLQEEMRIVSQREVARDIFELVLSGKLVQDMAVTGQFLNIKVPSESMLLRRPISISSWNKEDETCTLLYRTGDETSGTRILSECVVGQSLDVMGPLGTGFDIEKVQAEEHIVLVGGGIGVPPLYELAKQLNKIDCQITVILGFASADVKILESEFSDLENVELQIMTDDGSYGKSGHVGLAMEVLGFIPDAVFACGPAVMLKSVYANFADSVVNVQLSLEARMACGIGACYACVVPDKNDENHAYKVCEDGPVFQAEKVVL
ncbi:dihydroorotate dehydrogenase electron transfer subunit [Lactococcus nasutitermitis]|uniref:Dihydroorotate dehydrogenase B (NAD(+)), electron transfer subunit n=1 Tax=Lactococcus nasutitermitis TaxID=1652957 RepID=A0ABV9JDC0_9LACT|nr:dihydroorotate dehydrogenase electron transfer subunit [Lactococcus nasutitermitis]